MDDTLDGNLRGDKGAIPSSQGVPKASKLRRMRQPRNAQHPVKLRAEERARALGMTLAQVYEGAGVNKTYLSDVPKNGWQEDKLYAIARQLGWTVDILMGRRLETDTLELGGTENAQLLEMAIEIAVELVRNFTPPGGEKMTSPGFARIGRMIYEGLRLHVSQGEPLPSPFSLRIWGRLLITELSTRSTPEDTSS